MTEQCPVCQTECEENATACSVCGFTYELGINRKSAVREDLEEWKKSVLMYREKWKTEKQNNDLLAQIEAMKKEKADLQKKLQEAESKTTIVAMQANNTFTDLRDGKVYRTVTIGNQVWMAENLNYDAPSSKFYNNDPANGEKYGRLYNWDTAMKIAPLGWHLPSDDEWQELVDFVGGEKVAGKKLKARNGWGNGTDNYDFSALPGGCVENGVFVNVNGKFDYLNRRGFWWSASEWELNGNKYVGNHYWSICIDYYEKINRKFEHETSLFSVRYVQDDFWNFQSDSVEARLEAALACKPTDLF